MSISISKYDNGIAIAFPYDEDLIESVKSALGARWNRDARIWTVSAVHAQRVIAWGEKRGARIDQDVHALIEAHAAAVAAATAVMVDDTATTMDLPASIAGALRPYQRAGIVYMLAHRRAIQADEMGLGKTVQALAAAEAAGGFPVLVLAPASLLRNWKNESARWLPNRRAQIISKGKDQIDPAAEIVIASYDISKSHQGIQATRWVSVIADEAHALKNGKAARTKALAPVVSRAANRWLLSGTPIKNRPADLIEPLRMLGHLEALGGWRTYVTRYCDGSVGRYGWEIDGASNLAELRRHLAALGFVRRVKSDVLAELPPKIRSVLPVELDAAAGRAVRDAETVLRAVLAGQVRELSDVACDDASGRRGDVLGALAKLRRAVGIAKVPAACAWVSDAIEQEEKLLVFAHHTDVLDGIEAHLKKVQIGYVRLDGSTPTAGRQDLVDKFQSAESVRVFLGSMTAAGQGVTLTAASQVLICEQAWTPAEMDQAEDRAHRIGQRDTVTATHLIAVGSIDEPVLELINTKRQVAAQAVDGATEVQAAESIEKMLLARFSEAGKAKPRTAKPRKTKPAAQHADPRQVVGQQMQQQDQTTGGAA